MRAGKRQKRREAERERGRDAERDRGRKEEREGYRKGQKERECEHAEWTFDSVHSDQAPAFLSETAKRTKRGSVRRCASRKCAWKRRPAVFCPGHMPAATAP